LYHKMLLDLALITLVDEKNFFLKF
jgi:hypothetical protein